MSSISLDAEKVNFFIDKINADEVFGSSDWNTLYSCSCIIKTYLGRSQYLDWLYKSYNKTKIKDLGFNSNIPSNSTSIGLLVNVARDLGVNLNKPNDSSYVSIPLKDTKELEAEKAKQAEETHRENARKHQKYKWKESNFTKGLPLTETDFRQNPYLLKKSKHFIEISDNVRMYNDVIYIKAENKPTIQTITTDRRFQRIDKITQTSKLPDQGQTGSYAQLSKPQINDGDTLYIVEGIATAFPFIHVGLNVFWAICAYNLKHVANILREKYPTSKIKICADNDKKLTGITEAKKCGTAEILLPPMTIEEQNNEDLKGVDWNDLWLSQGDGGFIYQFGVAENRIAITSEDAEASCNINKNIKEINCKYITDELTAKDILLDNHITVIKSVQGTGKTTIMMEALKENEDRKKTDKTLGAAICVVKSVFLTKQLYNKAVSAGIKDCVYYDDFNTNSNDSMFIYNTSEVIFTTPESFKKISNSTIESCSLLIMDEAEQVSRNVTSFATHKTDLPVNFTKLSYALAKSRYTIALDADIGMAFETVVADMHNRNFAVNKKVYNIVNNYKKDTCNILMYDSSKQLNIELLEAIKTKKIFIGCTFKAEAYKIADMIHRKYPNKKGLVFTGDNKKCDEIAYRLKTMDFSDLDFLCVSPAAATGLDISNHKFTATFLDARTVSGVTTADKIQLMNRARNITDIRVFTGKQPITMPLKWRYEPIYVNRSIAYEEEKLLEAFNAEVNKRSVLYKEREVVQSYQNNRDVSEDKFDKSLLRLLAIEKREKGLAINDPCADFIRCIEDKGYTFDFFEKEHSKDELEELKELLAEIKEEHASEVFINVSSSNIYNDRQWELLINNELTDFEKARAVKTKAIVYLGIHEEDKATQKRISYSYYSNYSKFRKLEENVKISAIHDKDLVHMLKEQEKNNPMYMLDARNYLATKSALFKDILAFLNINHKTGKLDSNKNVTWSKEENIQQITNFVSRYQKILGNAVSVKAPVRSFNKILKDLGIETSYSRHTTSDDTRVNIYYVESTSIYKKVLKYYVRKQVPEFLPKENSNSTGLTTAQPANEFSIRIRNKIAIE